MQIKKAILTGGGRATRLRPITSTMNKHSIPLANKPMIFHAIQKVVDAGIEEIFINTNPGETELQKLVGDGGHWGIKIKFFEQTGGPQGIAHVVKLAEQFIGNDPFMFYLSDNVILGSLKDILDEFVAGGHDSMLALAEVPNAKHFGVPYFDEQGRLIDVVEKPENPPNNFAVTGIYLYGPGVFFKAFDNITKSARGEYEISSINSYILKNKQKVGHKIITGWWKDEMTGGKSKIGVGTTVGENVKIIDPVIVGENCTLENCTIGPHVTIGSGSIIKGGVQISNSIILNNCHLDIAEKIVDSIVGEKVTIVQKHPEHYHRMIVGDQTIIEM
jgi:glucose-1-phosphate thymidylyltransferase